MSFELQYDATVASWNRPYVGDHHRILVDSMRQIKREENGMPYRNILPIIQSSGMGKSRLAHEAGIFVVTLPLCIRFRAYDIAWPPPDHQARDFLEAATRDVEEARTRHLAFFIAMFQCASSRIKAFSDKVYEDEESLGRDWKAYLDADDRAARRQYFDDVVKEANEAIRVTRIGSSAERKARMSQHLRDLKAKAPEQSRELVRAIESRLKGGFKHPELAVVVYIDEVSEISKTFIDESVSLYDTLLEAFTDLGPDNPLFLLPIATNPAIIRRGGSPIRHQPPWSELPFDLLPNGPLFCPGTMTMRDVSDPNYQCKFGRPLFWTRQEYMRTHGGTTRDFATEKLLCYAPIRDLLRPKSEGGVSCSPEMIFAVLATRLSLEFDTGVEEARQLTENMIYRHMRVAFSYPAHGDYVWSGAPSEPLLAEAAAEFMYKCHNVDWPGELADAVDRGIVKHTWRGDLLARLLLTLAFDRAGDDGCANKTFCDYDLYSAPVPVVDFLRALFADRWHNVVETALPVAAGAQGETEPVPLREAFKDAFVRFSHYIEFDGDSYVDVHVALAAVARGFAIRLVPAHDTVDLAIPVVMRDEKLTTKVISFIFIKLKTKHERVELPDREYIDQAFPSDTSGKHPFIHIVMQLHPDASPPTDDHAMDPDQLSEAHPCYRLTAYGCSPTVYRAVNDQNKEHFATLAQPNNTVMSARGYTPQRIFHGQRLKFEWDHSFASLDWMGGDAAKPEAEDNVEGVFAV